MYGPSNAQWNFGLIVFFIGLTFGLWKIVEVIIWLFKHLHWA